MTVFRLKSAAFERFLKSDAGIIKCREVFALRNGDEVKIANADVPESPPLIAIVRGTHYERDPQRMGGILCCYVIE